MWGAGVPFCFPYHHLTQVGTISDFLTAQLLAALLPGVFKISCEGF